MISDSKLHSEGPTEAMTEYTSVKTDRLRLPDWFRRMDSKVAGAHRLKTVLQADVPNSICQEAKCPNRGECWSKGVLTFMILGTVCTRSCGFCAVAHGRPAPPDPGEIDTVLDAIDRLNLRYVVMTSPNRDDLADGGAAHYAMIIQGIRQFDSTIRVEVLIPDFKGDESALNTVIEAKPDVINHNIETVPELYRTVRRGAIYQRSLDLLSRVETRGGTIISKTGLMVGLGETLDQLRRVFDDVASRGIRVLTIGQYLPPDKDSLPIVAYYTPDEFEKLKQLATVAGIPTVFSGPHIRSSYMAESVFASPVSAG